jgi:hypothetical protein
MKRKRRRGKELGSVLQGVCVDPQLFPEEVFYLFPNGSEHFYASRFPNKNAHIGCFQVNKFQVIQEEQWPPEPTETTVQLEIGRVYKAELIWRNKYYQTQKLQSYYLKRMSRGNNITFFKDKELKDLCGCFPVHWFEGFQLIEESRQEESVEFNCDSDIEVATQFEQLQLF